MSLSLGALTFSALQSLLGPALPTMQRDLETTQAGISWTMTAWLLAAAVATPIVGRLGDMVGRRRMLFVVLASVVLGTAISSLATDLWAMILGRVLQGLGASVSPLAFGILRHRLAPARVSTAIGMLSAVLAVGGGLGTVLAGPIIDAFGWRGLFWLPAVLLFVTAALVYLSVPRDDPPTPGRVNLTAAVLLGGWLVALLLPLTEAPSWGWASPPVIGSFIAAIVLLAVWVRVESRSSNPLIDLKLLTQPTVWRTDAIAVLFGAAQFAALTFAPQLLQVPTTTGYGLGLTPTGAGIILLPILVMMTLGGLVSGPLLRALGLRSQLGVSAGLLAAGLLGFALFHESIPILLAEGAVFGLGLGLGFASMTSLVVETVPPTQTGAATGVVSNARVVGGAIGTAAFTAILSGSTQGRSNPAESGYELGFLTLTVMALTGVVIAISAIRRKN
jgi:predicted MFS family arabinose efflux permease